MYTAAIQLTEDPHCVLLVLNIKPSKVCSTEQVNQNFSWIQSKKLETWVFDELNNSVQDMVALVV